MMLKVHKPNCKLSIIPIASILSISILLGFYGLTYTPELSHAETVTYEPKETRTLADITYMQDINVDICTNTPEADTTGNNQYQLKDARDQKTYWVAKLKDGNCWMTQNLAYDIPNADIGIPSSWGSDNAANKYYNPGEYVYTTPSTPNNCGTSGIYSLASCTSKGWINVTGWIATDSSDYANVADIANEIYDAHYLSGNYYSWNAATAGSGSNTTNNTDASSDICPAGWQLPTNSGSKSYSMLLTAYGAYQSNTLIYGTQDIRLAPLYFVYGGYVHSDSLGYVGSRGHYWSSTARVAFETYVLAFSTSVNPSSSGVRYGGFSVRCVARTEPVSNNNVEIVVNNTISLAVDSEIEVEKSNTNPSTADLNVKVASNQPYSVNISSDSPALKSGTSEVTIPSNGGALTTNVNNWGIMKPGGNTYTKVTTSPQLFYQATAPEVKDILFKIGISTSPDLPNGEYSTEVTVTATQN